MTDEIWMGRAEVRPLEGAHSDLADATYAAAVILAYASSHDAFEAVFDAILADEHLELVDLEEVGPIREVWDLDDKYLSALETAASGDPSVTIHHTNEPADAEDADMETVRGAAASAGAVQFRLMADDSFYFGFPV